MAGRRKWRNKNGLYTLPEGMLGHGKEECEGGGTLRTSLPGTWDEVWWDPSWERPAAEPARTQGEGRDDKGGVETSSPARLGADPALALRGQWPL